MNRLVKMRYLIAVLGAISTAFFQSSCLPDYFPRHELKERISEEQLIGTWHLMESSVAMFERHNMTIDGQKSTIEFLRDGRCILQGFAYGDDLTSGPATWKIEHDVAEGGGVIRKNELQIIVVSKNGSGVCFFNFSRKYTHLIFWQYYGDPDSREYIEYERR